MSRFSARQSQKRYILRINPCGYFAITVCIEVMNLLYCIVCLCLCACVCVWYRSTSALVFNQVLCNMDYVSSSKYTFLVLVSFFFSYRCVRKQACKRASVSLYGVKRLSMAITTLSVPFTIPCPFWILFCSSMQQFHLPPH